VFLVTAVSFNQPTFCSTATWNSTAITFADNNTVGAYPYGVFVNTNNTVYVANHQYGQIQVWIEGSVYPTRTIFSDRSYPYSLFVTNFGNIYFGNNGLSSVEIWSLNTTSNATTLSVSGQCWSLSIDTNNSLYCSLYSLHQVIKRSLNSSDNKLTIVAGTGWSGFLFNMLYSPSGIFVDINFNLYVADSGNNRIQLFLSGQLNGITVAGNGALGTMALNFPTGIVLDAHGYLFIVDSYNQRIVGSGPNGFRCVAGCSGYGSSSDQLANPQSMAFDSYGNIFVTDKSNSRIQKFLLATNSCGKCFNMTTK
jgi:hypothetical protein